MYSTKSYRTTKEQQLFLSSYIAAEESNISLSSSNTYIYFYFHLFEYVNAYLIIHIQFSSYQNLTEYPQLGEQDTKNVSLFTSAKIFLRKKSRQMIRKMIQDSQYDCLLPICLEELSAFTDKDKKLSKV